MFPNQPFAKRRLEADRGRYIGVQEFINKERHMYIGIGTVVVILLVLLLIGVLR